MHYYTHIQVMKFEWDEVKRQSNLRKHGIDFADAGAVFTGAVFTFADDRFDYSEERFITLGLLLSVVVVIAHTEDEGLIRIISVRKATRHEHKIYFSGLSDRLG